MLNNVKACLFDLDGTLVDSMWMWKTIDIEYLERFNLPCPADFQAAIEGMSFTETVSYMKNRFSIPDSLDKIKKDIEDMSVDLYRNKVPFKPGAEEFLKLLKKQDIRTAIATSNGRNMVDAVVEALHMENYIDYIITACEVNSGKPSPDIYLKAAEELKVAPVNCLVFEDIPAGIIAGKRAGMKVCAIEDEYSKDMLDEKKNLADYYIKDYVGIME